MEATDNWNFWLTLCLLSCWVLSCRCNSCWLRSLLHRAALSICWLALMLTLVGGATLGWLHAPFSWLVLWLVFLWRRSLAFFFRNLDLMLRSTARPLFEKHLLILLSHWSILIWGHDAVIYWNISQHKGVVHGCW